MIKKITLTLILLCLLVSCGKKGDPVFKDSEKKAKMQSFLLKKV